MEAMNADKYSLVTHPRDPRFLALRSLQNQRDRIQTGLYRIEGIRHVARALECRAPMQSVFLEPSVLTNRFGQKLARRLRLSGVPGIRLSPQLYREITLATEPQGIGVALHQHWTPLGSLRLSRDSLWLAVESIDSPGNLGTIVRTAEATGVSGIFTLSSGSDHSNPDPWDPAAVRASMGSLFSQKLVRCSNREFVEWAKAYGVCIVGSSPGGLLDCKALRYRWPVALLIGSERHGLSDQLIETADFMVRIPMRGGCDSINAAVAAGVLLFEMANQRREA
jgi:TrmH family RNA methyltransferase